MLAKLSVVGLYQFDPTIFDQLVLPSQIDKDDLIGLICMETAELPTVYPDPDVFRLLCGSWSRRHLHSWQRMAAALYAEYNPIENYDRHEDYTDNRSGSSSSASSNSGTDTQAATAYNTEAFADTERMSTTGHASSSAESAENATHTARIHGNIGVTTSAQMIAGELEIRQRTLYDEIVQDFIDTFCVGVY